MTVTSYWIVGWLGSTLSICLFLAWRRQKGFSLTKAISVALIALTIGYSLRLSYKLLTSRELQELLESDTSALALGIVAILWVSIEQLRELGKSK